MGERTQSEFNELNAQLEKRLYETDEFYSRLSGIAERLGQLQPRKEEVMAKTPCQPLSTNVDSIPQLHRLTSLSNKVNDLNTRVRYLVEELERMV